MKLDYKKKEYLANIEVLNTTNFIQPNITSLTINLNVSISSDQLNKICALFPNIMHLKIDMFNKSFLIDCNNGFYIYFPFEVFNKLESVIIYARSLTITGIESICKLAQMPTLKTLHLRILLTPKCVMPVEITSKLTNSFNGKLTSKYDVSHERYEFEFKAT